MNARTVRLLSAAALVAVSCGCGAKTIRAYEGDPLPPERAVRIRSGSSITFSAVDGRPIGDFDHSFDLFRYSDRVLLELTPGPHRLTVGYRATQGNVVQYSVNDQTISHTFAPGDYSFVVSKESLGTSSVWHPKLIDSKTKAPIVEAQPPGRPDAPSASKPGTATVTGVAIVGVQLAAGQRVALIARNKRTDEWAAAWLAWNKRQAAKVNHFDIPPLDPGELKSPVRSTVGYGVGYFEFKDVPPGEYYAVFKTYVGLGYQPVTVKPSDRLVERVMVTDHVSDAGPASPAR